MAKTEKRDEKMESSKGVALEMQKMAKKNRSYMEKVRIYLPASARCIPLRCRA